MKATQCVIQNILFQAAAARSKTVILVKNLPAGTNAEEIQAVFEKYGIVGQVLLPPSGITAIVQFIDPGEAQKAFKSLALTKVRKNELASFLFNLCLSVCAHTDFMH